MLVLPVPMIVALLLGFLFFRSLLVDQRQPFLSVLLLACAGQSVLTSLVLYYGIGTLQPLQPVTASIIPAIVWVAFVESCLRQKPLPRDYMHLCVPVLVIPCVLFVPAVIDTLLVVLFVGYGGAILFMLHVMKDDLAHMRLSAGHLPALIWRIIAIALIISAISDTLISLSLAYGFAALPGWILSISSSLGLLVIGYLCVSRDIEAKFDTAENDTAPYQPIETGNDPARNTQKTSNASHTSGSDISTQPEPDAQNSRILRDLSTLLEGEKLYLDPDLTLARLSRKMGVPLKQLSTAINAVTGENVSRLINGYRIGHACTLLAQGQSVTTAMLDSGFNTKSNFNREFSRITGQTPSAWITARPAQTTKA